MNHIPEKNMETVLKEIKELRGLEGLGNGRLLVALFSDLSTDKKDLRLIRYLVESGCHTDLLEARDLSSAMQQARLQQTVKKLCAETLISEEASAQVCTAFWHVLYGTVPEQKMKKETVPERIPEPIQHLKNRELPRQQSSIPDRMPAAASKQEASGAEKKPFGIKAAICLLAAAMLIAVLVLPALLKKEAPASQNQTQENPEKVSLSELVRRKQSENGSRVLKADPFQYNVDSKGYLLTYPAFGTNLMRDQIASITFLNTITGAPEEIVDVSENQDRSVLSWVVPNGNLFDLYIAAEGGVKAPVDSSGLFACCINAASISFNNSFDTSSAVSMHMMFYCCDALTELDLSGINTGNVKTMDFFFAGCDALTSVDVSQFDTAKVTSFSSMFDTCIGLKSIDVGNFDTSNAVKMDAMFKTCWSLEKLDLSGFNTQKVTNMSFMFSGCRKLTELNISSFDTSSVTDMRYMFKDASNIQNLDLSGFDVSNVTEYRNFMDDDSKINGRPWETLFTS